MRALGSSVCRSYGLPAISLPSRCHLAAISLPSRSLPLGFSSELVATDKVACDEISRGIWELLLDSLL